MSLVGIGIGQSAKLFSSRRKWALPTPPASECAPSPRTGRGAQSPAGEGEGLGESQFRRMEKSLALCLLCDIVGYLSRAFTIGIASVTE
jgi:hypothetical protein